MALIYFGRSLAVVPIIANFLMLSFALHTVNDKGKIVKIVIYIKHYQKLNVDMPYL